MDDAHAVGEVTGQDSEPGPHLEDDVGRAKVAHPADHSEDVLVDEEVLSERLLGLGPSRQPERGCRVRVRAGREFPGLLATCRGERRIVWTT